MTSDRPADAVYRYKAISYDAQPGNRLEEVANRMGRRGWRLVTTSPGQMAVFEKKHD